MAYPQPRSVNSELERGMVDGTYKQVNPNRGGYIVEGLTRMARSQMSIRLYGMVEAPVQALPDGSDILATAYTVNTPDPERMFD